MKFKKIEVKTIFNKISSKYDFLNSDFETKMQAFILDNINFAMQRYLKRSDSIGMMNSVELRIPFLDYDLFNFVVNSPLKYKIQFIILL